MESDLSHSVRHTLPHRINIDRNTALDQPLQTDQGRLHRSSHRAGDYPLDSRRKRTAAFQMHLQILALLNAVMGELWVGQIIVLCNDHQYQFVSLQQ